ncbi:MAG: BadF/BadG/BcrA/BcrD ATPase family protein [Bryocella sp.]
MRTYVAIDGGGTNTRCWVADNERVLGRAACGTVKIMNVGETLSTARLQQLVRDAAAEAGVDLARVTRTCVGLAGISSARVMEWGQETLGALVGGEVIVVGDEDIALEAAFQGGPGVFLIAGTGSIMLGRASSGQKFGGGGFGPVLGDEGSAGWIGWEGIRAGLKAMDRGQPTQILDAVIRCWGLDSLGALIAKGNDSVRPQFGEVAGAVVECATGGDAVAQRVLERAGFDLAEQVLLVVEKMRAAGCAAEDYSRLAFTGSAVGKVAAVREAMTRRLHEALPSMHVASEEVSAVEGALWLARQG